jgi:hypothetical protein
MKINPEIEVVESIIYLKKVRELTNLFDYKSPKKNNRKHTRGRKRQIITFQINNSFPPIFKVRTIIH